MKWWVFSGLITIIAVVYALHAAELLKQPGHFAREHYTSEPLHYQKTVRGIYFPVKIKRADLQQVDAVHRHNIDEIVTRSQQEKEPRLKLRTLQQVRSVNTRNENVNTVLSNIGIGIGVLLKETVRYFDHLLPILNSLHYFFALLQNNAQGLQATYETFYALHREFLTTLYIMAQRYYKEGLFYYRRGNNSQASNLMLIAQGLLYKIKDESDEAMKLYQEINTYFPQGFSELATQPDIDVIPNLMTPDLYAN